MTAEVRHSPTPRFSDEAYAVISASIQMYEPLGGRMSAPQVSTLAAVIMSHPQVTAEFDAACLSAWRSGQETAGRDLAERLRAKAASPGSDVGPYGGEAHLCADAHHDDRFCMECDRMNAGLLVAADLVERWSKEGSDG